MADNVAANMRAIAERIRAALPGASRAGANVIRAEVARAAPEASGQLKRDVYVRTVRTSNGRVVSVVQIRRRSFHWVFQEFGTSTQQAKPFFRPAAEAAAGEAGQVAVQQLRDVISKGRK